MPRLRPTRRHGYCTEAARVLLRYAFLDLGLVRVHASYFTRNLASGRVMQKIGMRREGCRRHHVIKWDKTEDLDEVYGILKVGMGRGCEPSGGGYVASRRPTALTLCQ